MKKIFYIALLAMSFSLQSNALSLKPLKKKYHSLTTRLSSERSPKPIKLTMKDLRIEGDEIIATIDGKDVPVRFVHVGKKGKVFVTP